MLPILGVLGHFALVWLAPPRFLLRFFLAEQGPVEIGTVVFYGVAACTSVALGVKTKGFVPNRYRVFYFLFALGASFIALEEMSYGQHLFGWESPQWFATHNEQMETNLHNLFGSSPGETFNTLSHILFPMGFILLPVLVMRRNSEYQPDHWAYYLLPKSQLITVVAVPPLLEVLRKLPPSVLTGAGLSELIELYWAAAALLYMVILWRRLISSDWDPLPSSS